MWRMCDGRVIGLIGRAAVLAGLAILASGPWAGGAWAAAGWDLDRAIDAAKLQPNGDYYEATVPDTLDLARRAALSVHALTSFGNPDKQYAPYGQNFLNGNPAYLSWFEGGPPNWGNIGESLVLTRHMSGSRENLQIDPIMLRGMAAYIQSFIQSSPIPTPASVVMLGLMPIFQLDPDNAALRKILDDLAAYHGRVGKATVDGRITFWDQPPDMSESFIGIVGYGMVPFIQGLGAHSLSCWGVLGGDRSQLDFSARVIEFQQQPLYWQPEGAPKAVVGSEHGQFMGHQHSYLSGLKGLLCYAEATGDARLMQSVREGYEYYRTFGLARIGLFGEGCSTGDIIFLAVKLSDLGVGDYWEDVDCYVRNHLAELQLDNEAKLQQVVATMPAGRGKNDRYIGKPFNMDTESTDSAAARSIGAFLSDSTHPALVPEQSLLYTICCTGNCNPALYAAWDATVRSSGDSAQVNLLLNRASAWCDIDSYLPYEGKVVVHNKTARTLSVRMPLWVSLDKVKADLGGVPARPSRFGRYLVFFGLKPGDTLTLTFPVAETTETWTLKWKQTDFWCESTNPGNYWNPLATPDRYTLTLRGNTVVDIAPRPQGRGYPLYQREAMKAPQAPMIKMTRYVSPITFKW